MRERRSFEREMNHLLREAPLLGPENAGKWRRLFPSASRSRASFLLDGEQYFASVIRALETAKTSEHSVYILGWMLDIDFQLSKSSKKTLFTLLRERADMGVEIRILVWDNWIPEYAKKNKDALARLNKLPNAQAFVDAHPFFPASSQRWIQQKSPLLTQLIQKYGKILLSPAAELERNYNISGQYILYRLLSLMHQKSLGAHHEKVVIVQGDKGLIGFCGGIDFNRNRVFSKVPSTSILGKLRKEFVERRFPAYHDNACQVDGCAAYDLLQRFKRRWANHAKASEIPLRQATLRKPPEAPSPYPFVQIVGTYNHKTDRDRSLKDAYLRILENAEKYIYIEDQYLVNLDVARVLNRKLKEPGFKKLTFAIQQASETKDALIPNRKRGDFLWKAVLAGLSPAETDKVLFATLDNDKTRWITQGYHPGMHAKTLIVDDEIAVIGSANVNQRSFTCDSETSVVVFDETRETEPGVKDNFARKLRIATWKEFLRKPTSASMVENWWSYPNEIARGNTNFSQLVKYAKDDADDWDVRIKDYIRKGGAVSAAVALHVTGGNIQQASSALSPFAITPLFDELWEHVIDPVFP